MPGEGFFQLGDLLVLGLVAVGFFLYNRLDRNSKTLEKVRSYADKVRGELDRIIGEKKGELQELTVNLDVEEKKNREILSRFVTARDNVLKQADTLVQYQQRVDDYNTRLDELQNMTGKIDENLLRLHQESKYIDQVGLRLNEVQNKEAALVKGLNAINAAFQEQNREKFDELAVRFNQRMDKEMETFRGEITKLTSGVEKFRHGVDELVAARDKVSSDRIKEYGKALDQVELQYKARLQSAVDRGVKLEDEAFNGLKKLIDQKYSGLEENWKGGMVKLRDEVLSLVEEMKGRMTDNRNAYESFYEKTEVRMESLADRLDQADRDIADQAVEAMRAAEEKQKQYESVLKANFNRIEGMLGDFADLEKSLKKGLDDTASRLKIDFDRYRRTLEEDMDRIRGEAEESADAIRRQCESMDRIKGDFVKALESQRVEMEQDLSSRMEAVRTRVEKEWSDFGARLAKEREEERARASAELERVSSMYGELNDQVEALKKNAHEAAAERLADFERELTADLDSRKSTLEEKFLNFQNSQEKLRADLENRFTRDLEAKLAERQTHVDGVLSTLEERSTRLSTALENWKKGLETEINDISEAREKERVQMETRFTTQLDEKIRKISDEVNRNLDDLKTKSRETHDTVAREVTSAEQEIERSRNEVRNQVASLKKETKETLVKVDQDLKSVQKVRSDYLKGLEDIKVHLDRKIDEFDKDIDKQIHLVAGKIQSKSENLEIRVLKEAESRQKNFQKTVAERFQKLDKVFSDMDAMEASVGRSLTDMQGKIDQRFGGFREEMDKIEEILVRMKEKSIDNLNQEISGFEKQMRAEILAREGSLKDDIGKISGHALENLDKNLEERTRVTMEKFQSEFENHKAQIQKFVAQIEFDYDRISSGIAGIEHKQKEYLIQTKLFEKTDQLKDQLSRDLARLEQLTLKVSGESQSLNDIRERVEALVSEYNDASEKITRFLSEKQKIDLMENKIDRVLQTSEAVDQKVTRLNDLNDTLQQYQVRLKQMEDFHAEITARYERLEKKLPVIDTTTDGIDKTFGTLDALQKQVRSALEDMQGIPEALSRLEERNNNLFLEGDRLNLLLNRVETLDNDLSTVESRIQEMEKTREWLAKTETRMEALNKELQDKIRLLGNVTAKEGGSTRSSSRGAPDMDTRDMVIKLAREGWKTEEIARTTKLGQGEVELILEMSQRRK